MTASSLDGASPTGGGDQGDEEVRCAVGTKIYVSDPADVWKTAEVVKIQEDGSLTARVDADNELVHLRKGDLWYLCNTDVWNTTGLSAPTDLTMLTHLHEAAVLDSLNLRFDIDEIYTFTGPILIAVNPFKQIAGLYDMKPHVFASSSAAYEGMCNEKQSQTILISGESGAGKTESTKFVMKFLACAGSDDLERRSQVEAQVLESNPLLEAFGNARTLRNDNSSRFGKFIELQFQTNKTKRVSGNRGRLCGARIQTYLLEKVRVCDQQEGERNYHIFYQLCAAAEAAAQKGGIYYFPSPKFRKAADAKPQEMDMSLFEPRDKFKYLTKSSCHALQGVDDCEEFDSTVFAMQTVGISPEEQMNIFSVVGAVLCLGNVSFETPKGNSEGSQVAPSCAEYVSKACRLLGVESDALQEAMCYRTIKTMHESYRKPLKTDEAWEMKDALCRALYGCLFLQVVARTNQSIGYLTEVKSPDDVLLFCGVLDIFGFECFAFNSFEQLCINFTNERLQNFFNTFVFKCEEELYRAEGIQWNPLDFPDNADCVALLQDKPLGLFSMLDEECMVPAGKDRGFNNKVCQKHTGHKRFGVIKTKPNCFVVHHFAGSVEYCSDGFLEKNKDQLSLDLQEAIKASSIAFVSHLFTAFLNRGASEDGASVGKKRKFVTVSSEFREQLGSLMDTVNKTAPHFIRCIKPNPQNLPDLFDRVTVNEQLRYGGVLQAVQVSRAGYPVRLSHRDCFFDYKALADKAVLEKLCMQSEGTVSSETWRERAQALLLHLDAKLNLDRKKKDAPSHDKTWAVGKSLCFFKNEAYEVLSASLMSVRVQAATAIQARYKCFVQRRFFLMYRQTVVFLQSHVRMFLCKLEAWRRRQDRAAKRIETFLRGAVARLRYLRTLKQIKTIQAAWRGKQTRSKLRDLQLHEAAGKIQATWKMHRQRASYRDLRKAATLAQLKWKRILARRMLRRLREEAREVSGLLKKAQDLQRDLGEERSKRSEVESHVLQLQAKNEELLKEIQRLHKELDRAKEEVASLQASNEDFASQVKQLKESLTAGSSTPSTPQMTPGTQKRRLSNHADAQQSQGDRLSTQTDEELKALRQELEKREAEAQLQQSEHETLIAKLQASLKEAESALEQEKTQRSEAEARYKLVLEDSSASSTHFRLSSAGAAKQQPGSSLASGEAGGVSSTLLREKRNKVPDGDGALAATKTLSPLPSVALASEHWECVLHDQRWIDLLLLGPAGVGKTGLLEQFLIKLGDEVHLEQLRVSRKMEDQAPFSKLPQHYELVYPRDSEDAPTRGAKPRDDELTRVNVLDFPGPSRTKQNPALRVKQAFVVAVVYDPTRPETCDEALQVLTNVVLPCRPKVAAQDGLAACVSGRVYLVENGWRVAAREGTVQVDTAAIRDKGTSTAGLRCHYRELVHLESLVDEIVPLMAEWRGMLQQQRLAMLQHHARLQPGSAAGLSPFALPRPPAQASRGASLSFSNAAHAAGSGLRENGAEKSPSVSGSASGTHRQGSLSANLFDSIRSFLSQSSMRPGPGSALASGAKQSVDSKLLRPSMKPGGSAMLKKLKSRNMDAHSVVPVQELQDSDSAITCVVFGKEKDNRDYILLAAASKDGSVVIYRCYRLEAERQMFDQEQVSLLVAPASKPPGDNREHFGPSVSVHSRLVGHSRAVTCLFFSLLEDQLVTTSIDKSVRFWHVDTGDMLKVFTDSSPALAAAFLPFNPTAFVASNSNSILRLVCATSGRVIQKLKVESEVRALKFDDTGLFCFAGTKAGAVHVLEASDTINIRFKFKTTLGKGAVTCITFVPSTGPGQYPRLLINCCDSSVAIVECIYGPPPGVLTNLLVRHRVRIAHSLLPLRCWFSNFGGGWLITGSEDKDVYCFSLQQGANFKAISLKHHQAPILAVATNLQDTLLVSADSMGKLVLWRSLDFSGAADASAGARGRAV
ncbi:Myosin, related [Neospora caninum Liverpool]|uniref:Myosin, related n=1 Tax=Neospora caninum (strain Liverpool) TaxID=572307 RepID=F0VRE1_NEOCL|nr:Myosin, related [Neospora caninum Liverpool]CBZ56289.1 Myosin, related [Neospora caninum Liverpool]|eukprot:XP_003886314.1 Myosin, related [Neospora caninum Liverpool]